MDWVADGIALGGLREAQDHPRLQREGVTAVLQLYGPDPCPDGFPFAAAVLQLQVIDGKPLPGALLRQGIGFITEQRCQGRGVLVTCGQGVSRSAAFAAAYLGSQGMDIKEAVLSIQRRRPCVLPHPELLRSLLEQFPAPYPHQDLLVALVRQRKQLTG